VCCELGRNTVNLEVSGEFRCTSRWWLSIAGFRWCFLEGSARNEAVNTLKVYVCVCVCVSVHICVRVCVHVAVVHMGYDTVDNCACVCGCVRASVLCFDK